MADFKSKLIRISTLLILGLICTVSLFSPPNLSASEIDKPEIIVSAAEDNYPPFCVTDSHSNADGFSVELLRAALKAMGRYVSFRVDVWSEVKQSLIDKRIQVLPLVGRTPERESFFDFSFPYMTMHGTIVVRSDNRDITSMADLAGKQVAVMKGDNAEEFLRRAHPEVNVSTALTFDQALLALAAGSQDAVVMQKLLAVQLIMKHNIQNLKIIDPPLQDFTQNFCFAVAKGDAQLLSILNEGLSIVIADGTLERLRKKWFAELEAPEKNRIVVGGDADYPPYEYLDENGQPAGYNVDLTKAIAAHMGLDVEIQLAVWGEVSEKLANQEIDLLEGMFYSSERDKTFEFTQAHTLVGQVIVRRQDAALIDSLDGLSGKKIIVMRGDIMHDLALKAGFAHQLVLAKNQQQALDLLVQGDAEYALLAKVPALYWIKKNQLPDLSVGEATVVLSEYCYAGNDSNKALVARFSAALTELKADGTYRKIHQKWLGVYDDQGLSRKQIIFYFSYASVPIICLFILAFACSRTLRKKVAQQTLYLEEEISKRQQVEEQLRVSEQIYKSLYLDAPLPYQSLDVDGNYLAVNSAYLATLGYERDEVIGHWFGDFLHPDWKIVFEQNFPSFKQRGVVSNVEFRMKHKNGSFIDVLLNGCIGCNPDGGFRQTYCVFQDVTARKEIEEKLRFGNEVFEKLTSSARDGIIQINDEGKVVFWNKGATDIFGYSADEIMETDMQQLLVPEDVRGRHQVSFSEIVVTGQGGSIGKTIELEGVHKDGHIVSLELSLSSFDLNGHPQAMAVVRNITDRKLAEVERLDLESQLRQKYKMEAVGIMAGGMAHNFNNNLSIILGNIELSKIKTQHLDEITDYLNNAKIAVLRSRDLIKQIMTYSRQNNRGNATIRPALIIDETVQLLSATLPTTINLQNNLADGSAGIMINGDSSRIQECLINLCNNAMQAMDEDGHLTLSLDSVELHQQDIPRQYDAKPGSYARISVRDSGCGMNAVVLDKIFDLFFTTKGLDQGTGVGLSTVQGIVKDHGGLIKVISNVGQGTTFELYFPIVALAQPMVECSPSNEERPGGIERILLVDDDELVADLGEMMLAEMGYQVTTMTESGEALKLFAANADKFDLLITDQTMPVLTGKELIQSIKQIRPDIPVIICTGFSSKVDEREARNVGADAFLLKPLDLTKLLQTVRQVLDKGHDL